jgi:hypothetical protein
MVERRLNASRGILGDDDGCSVRQRRPECKADGLRFSVNDSPFAVLPGDVT